MTSSKDTAASTTQHGSYKITKADLNQINRRSLFGFQLGWNYERMQGSGYLYCMLPLMRKLYGDGSPELRQMMRTENQLMNTSNFFINFVFGIDMAIQEEQGTEARRPWSVSRPASWARSPPWATPSSGRCCPRSSAPSPPRWP